MQKNEMTEDLFSEEEISNYQSFSSALASVISKIYSGTKYYYDDMIKFKKNLKTYMEKSCYKGIYPKHLHH